MCFVNPKVLTCTNNINYGTAMNLKTSSSSLEEQMVLPSSLSSRLLAEDDPMLLFDGMDFLVTSNASNVDTAATVSLGEGASSGDEGEDSSRSSSSSCSGSDIVEAQLQQHFVQQVQAHAQHRPSRTSQSRKTAGTTGTATSDGSSNSSKSCLTTTYNRKKGSFTTKGYKRHFAVHNYTDYSRVRPSQDDLKSSSASSISKGGVHNPFPTVLHYMMEDLEVRGFTELCCWQPHGRAFLIKDPKRFVLEVLPLYFKHSKLSSFQRQLSLYGFKRLTSDGLDRGAYYHPCFLRGRPYLTSKIQRTRVKGTWVRTSSSPHTEPNFYHMDPVRDLTAMMSMPDEDDDDDSRHDDTEMDSSATGVPYTVTPTPTTDDKKTIQINFDLFNKSFGGNPVAMLPPPPLPSSVMATKNDCNDRKASQCFQFIGAAMSIVGVGAVASVGAGGSTLTAATMDEVPFVPSLHDDAELASFLSDIDLDMDITTM